MDDDDRLAARFETHRAHLRSVAYRMLGSFSDADDALQETWIRLGRSSTDEIENLGAWLTTVTSRVCLNMLRARGTRREEALDTHVPDPVITSAGGPEREAELADSVGLALLVVLETLSPAERVAFVLHDMFAMSFDEIATMMGRTSAATRQLASRARRRVRGAAVAPDADIAAQRVVVDAFFAAARDGDFGALVAVLDPDILLRSDAGPTRPGGSVLIVGAQAVAGQALMFSRLSPFVHHALINGTPGVVVIPNGRVASVMNFTIAGNRVIEINALTDTARLARLDLSALDLPTHDDAPDLPGPDDTSDRTA